MTVCNDTNVLLGFFNNEPEKVESCTAFFQFLFTKRKFIESLPLFSIAEFRNGWILRTAALKKTNRLAIADAIILSTAIETRCSYLITFDTDFMSSGEIQILTPQKFLELQN